MGAVARGLGIVNAVFGVVIFLGGCFGVVTWTWLAHSYSPFIWGGAMVPLNPDPQSLNVDVPESLLLFSDSSSRLHDVKGRREGPPSHV